MWNVEKIPNGVVRERHSALLFLINELIVTVDTLNLKNLAKNGVSLVHKNYFVTSFELSFIEILFYYYRIFVNELYVKICLL